MEQQFSPPPTDLPRNGLRRNIGQFHDRLRQGEHFYMVALAVFIGLLGGYGAVGFRMLIQLIQRVAWGQQEYSLDYIQQLPWFWIVLVPAVGGLVVAEMVRRLAPEAKGHGVPEVMEAVALREGRIRPRVVLIKALASGLSIGSGGSVGREGPIVQIGSAFGSTIGQLLHVSGRRLRTLVGCGAAAGIAATFNAPVAGALFSVEVILGDFAVSQFSPIVVSSVLATVVSRHYLGEAPAFQLPNYELHHPLELIPYALLGIGAGLVALAFCRLLYRMEDNADRLPLPVWLKGFLGGGLVGLIALRYPHVLGVGYEAIENALASQLDLQLLLILLMVKILAVCITLSSGGSGGVFAPSLFIGAMLGGAIGTVVHQLFPHHTAVPGAYALVGMGAVVGAVTHAPITAIVIIFELTSSYTIILALMMACIISTLLAIRLDKASVYTKKLLRRGVDIHRGQDVNVLRALSVSDVMQQETTTVPLSSPLMEVLSKVMETDDRALFVTDERSRLHGVITLNDLRPILDNMRGLESLLVAADIARRDFPMVERDDNLDTVLKRTEQGYLELVPVVDEEQQLVGTVRLEDVINRYNNEMFKRDMAYGVSSRMQDAERMETVQDIEGFCLAEIEAPAQFYGHTLRELDVRRQYGVTVLLVKSKDEHGNDKVKTVPYASYRVQPGDHFLVIGESEQVNALRPA